MSVYNSIEQYLPEMKDVRAQYDLYLKENNISKTEEEKLFDYMVLISKAYASFNEEKMFIEFSAPNIAETIQQNKGSPINGAIRPISARMRYHEMQDCAEFSPFINSEICEEKDNINLQSTYAWVYRRFPADTKVGKIQKTDMVRYALNIKPAVGLFKKLDNFCLKYDAFDYKVAKEQMYNWRVDPVIIYAQKHNQKEMLEELEQLIKPYRRKDEYNVPGYKNLNNGIYIADEVKMEQIQQLKYDALTKEEKDVFMHPVADEDEQEIREERVMFDLGANEKKCPVKCNLVFWLHEHEYDYAVSNAQYQATKMIVNAYKDTQREMVKSRTKQTVR